MAVYSYVGLCRAVYVLYACYLASLTISFVSEDTLETI